MKKKQTLEDIINTPWNGRYCFCVNNGEPKEILTEQEARDRGLGMYVDSLKKQSWFIGPGPEPLGWHTIHRYYED